MLPISMWPGGWRHHLNQLNQAINALNGTPKRNVQNQGKKKVVLVSEHDWWVVWGVIFVTCPCKKGGAKLFKSKRKPGQLAPTTDMSIDKTKFDETTGKNGKRVMSWHQFKQMKGQLCHSFEDTSSAKTDPWWPISKLVDNFNANWQKWIVSVLAMAFDESTSSFQPAHNQDISSSVSFMHVSEAQASWHRIQGRSLHSHRHIVALGNAERTSVNVIG